MTLRLNTPGIVIPITWQTSIYYIAPTIIPRHRSHRVCLMLMIQTFRVAAYVHSYTSKPFQKLIIGKVCVIGEIKQHQNVSRFRNIPVLSVSSAKIETIDDSIAYSCLLITKLVRYT